jgi:hypothetical protein
VRRGEIDGSEVASFRTWISIAFKREVRDDETKRRQERCQKETPKIHSGKKESQTGEKK